MFVEFIMDEHGKTRKMLGPFKEIRLMSEELLGDDNGIAYYDAYGECWFDWNLNNLIYGFVIRDAETTTDSRLVDPIADVGG